MIRFSEAVQYAQKYVYHGQNNTPVDSGGGKMSRRRNKPLTQQQQQQQGDQLTVYIEIVINATNFDKVIDVISVEKERDGGSVPLPVRLV